MIRRASFVLAILAVSVASAAQADQAQLTAEEATGVAPLAVMFDARGTTDSDVSNPFHDIVYQFEFGEKRADPGYKATWGLDGDDFLSRLSKDRYVGGPMAGHVYDKPGVYQATVAATDPGGGRTSASLTIRVTDPSSAFPGAQTVCVRSGGGSFLGCPAGAEQLTTNNFESIASIASQGKRVLLRRGDQFAGNATFAPNKDAILGAFGSGPRPRVLGSGDFPVLQIGGTGARVMDIEFVSSVTRDGTPSTGVIEATGIRARVRKALLLRVKTTNGAAGIGFKGKGSDLHQVSIVDCEIGDVADRSDSKEGGKNIDGDYTRSMFLGNLIGSSPVGFLVRIYSINNSIFSFNKLNGRHSSKKSSLRIQGRSASDDALPSEFIIFSYNTYGPDVRESGQFKPPSTSFYNVIRNYIVEGNFMATGTGRFRLFGQNASFRNNIKVSAGSDGAGSIAIIERHELAKCDGRFCSQYPTKDIWIHNNTCYFTGSSIKPCLEAQSDVNAGLLEARKNLLYAPNSTQGDVASGPFRENGNLVRGRGESSPLVDSQPSLIMDFERVPPIADANIGASIDGLFDAVAGGGRPAPPVLLEVR